MSPSHVPRDLISRQAQVQYILSDIPFFAVGIFVFGASTSLFILKRINW